MKRWLIRLFLALVGIFFTAHLRGAENAAVTARETLVQAIQAEGPQQQKLLTDLGESGSLVVGDILKSWGHDSIYIWKGPDGAKVPIILEDQMDSKGKARAIKVIDGEVLKDGSGAELRFGPNDLPSAETDMRLRSAIQQTLDTLALSYPEPEARESAALKLGSSQKFKYVAVLKGRLAKETSPMALRAIKEAIALLQLGSPDQQEQLAAVDQLGQLRAIGALDNLKRLASKPNLPPNVLKAVEHSISLINEHVTFVNFFGTIFHGISLGSILLVVALGLAITFGLMGIINMAHGEMIAIGAYTCYVVQNVFGAGFGFSITLPFSFGGKPIFFGAHIPGLHATGALYESYFLIAVPLAFLMAALAGLLIERTVIRFLYRRPLESLLATWGVSLVMQQLFRMVFGANNVQVNSPSWLLGHFSLNDIIFGYNRIFVVGFALLIVLGTWLLLTKTPLGLLIRAVMQNRAMASSLGVRTAKVDMLTFAFGSGLAGLAGAFLSQIGNVGPSLGQSYIVDSFMTVVLGGVGSIVGTVCSAFGIGTVDQMLQQTTGSPVTGKIIVLVAIIMFLQWKPGGLFSARSRSLD
ncbi:MAG TPA: urea ABC transporter permease subunit UrtB [Verrucomicrobiae bacterium]|jgi:urea transport system permease protein